MNRKVSDNITKMSFILCILMVLYHIGWSGYDNALTTPVNIYDSISYIVFYFLKSIREIVTPAFGFISGFLFFFNTISMKQIYTKMRKRIKTLIIPYLLWNILGTLWVCLPYIIIKSKNKEEFFNNYDWFKSIFTWGGMPHFWYIFMLIFFTIIAPILYFILKNKNTSITLFVITLAYILYKNETLLSSRFVYICFIWGGIIGTHYYEVKKKMRLINEKFKFDSKIILYTSFLICWIVFYLNKIRLIDITIEIILILLLYFIIDSSKFKVHKWMLLTFWVYAVHYYLDGFMLRISFHIIPRTGLWVIINQLFIFTISVTIAFSSGILCKKYIPKLYNILCGERGLLFKNQ